MHFIFSNIRKQKLCPLTNLIQNENCGLTSGQQTCEDLYSFNIDMMKLVTITPHSPHHLLPYSLLIILPVLPILIKIKIIHWRNGQWKPIWVARNIIGNNSFNAQPLKYYSTPKTACKQSSNLQVTFHLIFGPVDILSRLTVFAFRAVCTYRF